MVQQVCKYAHGKYSKYASMHMASTASMPSIACGKPGKYGMVWYGMEWQHRLPLRKDQSKNIQSAGRFRSPHTHHTSICCTQLRYYKTQYNINFIKLTNQCIIHDQNVIKVSEKRIQVEYTLCTGELAITASKESDQPVNIDPFTEDQRFLQLAKWYNRPTLNISQAFQWYFICFVWRPSSNDL